VEEKSIVFVPTISLILVNFAMMFLYVPLTIKIRESPSRSAKQGLHKMNTSSQFGLMNEGSSDPVVMVSFEQCC